MKKAIPQKELLKYAVVVKNKTTLSVASLMRAKKITRERAEALLKAEMDIDYGEKNNRLGLGT